MHRGTEEPLAPAGERIHLDVNVGCALDLLGDEIGDVAAQGTVEGEHQHSDRILQSKVQTALAPVRDQEFQTEDRGRRLARSGGAADQPEPRGGVLDEGQLLRGRLDDAERLHLR